MKLRLDAQVIVVGGGIAGSSLLYELARRGVDALLLERGLGPSGASTIPAALLNPHRGRTARARLLDQSGLAAFWQLIDRLEESGADHGARRSGVLRVASDRRQATAWQRLCREASAPSPVWLEPAELPAPYHGPFGGLLVPHGGWVEPALLLASLNAAAGSAGARVLSGLRFTGWRRSAGGELVAEAIAAAMPPTAPTETPASADSSGGERLTFSATEIVLCLGAYDATACRLPRLELAPGVAASYRLPRAPAPDPDVPPLAGAVGLVVRGSEVIVSGGVLRQSQNGGRPTALAEASVAEATIRLREAATWSFPALEAAELGASWAGIRARRPSGDPVVRRLAPGVTLFAGLAGRGFLCAPLLAGRLADELRSRLRG